MATYRKLCLDAVLPEQDGMALARVLGQVWRADEKGEGGLLGPDGRFQIWVNAVPDAEQKSERVRLDIRTRRWRGIVVDSANPLVLATWWARALDGNSAQGEEGTWEVRGVPNMPVPLVFTSSDLPKTTANRVHWDITGDVEHLVTAGATVLRARGHDIQWHVLADPEGNEFCVLP